MYLNEEHDEILVPDLGGDRVYRFKKAPTGTWAAQSHIVYQPGGGPRHVAYYSTCHLYSIVYFSLTRRSQMVLSTLFLSSAAP